MLTRGQSGRRMFLPRVYETPGRETCHRNRTGSAQAAVKRDDKISPSRIPSSPKIMLSPTCPPILRIAWNSAHFSKVPVSFIALSATEYVSIHTLRPMYAPKRMMERSETRVSVSLNNIGNKAGMANVIASVRKKTDPVPRIRYVRTPDLNSSHFFPTDNSVQNGQVAPRSPLYRDIAAPNILERTL